MVAELASDQPAIARAVIDEQHLGHWTCHSAPHKRGARQAISRRNSEPGSGSEPFYWRAPAKLGRSAPTADGGVGGGASARARAAIGPAGGERARRTSCGGPVVGARPDLAYVY